LPETDTEEIFRIAAPLFVRLSRVDVAEPTETLPKLKLGLLTESTAAPAGVVAAGVVAPALELLLVADDAADCRVLPTQPTNTVVAATTTASVKMRNLLARSNSPVSKTRGTFNGNYCHGDCRRFELWRTIGRGDINGTGEDTCPPERIQWKGPESRAVARQLLLEFGILRKGCGCRKKLQIPRTRSAAWADNVEVDYSREFLDA
jgi:hypothetical protein